jgi:membrane associated rhomboid family serine protease
MSSSADLFVVCKQCGSEVSPYITECPYCGHRLRRRAPKLPRENTLQRGRRGPLSRLARGRLRRRPVPVIGRRRLARWPGEGALSPPYVTIALVALSCAVWIITRADLVSLGKLGIYGPLHGDWWRLLSSPFTYVNGLYEFVALLAVAIFGWLLERRHGHVVVLALFLGAGVTGALAATAAYSHPVVLGANAAALALLAAWAVPDLLAARAGTYYEGDLLGAGALAAVLLAIPFALREPEASWLAGLAGGALGLALGAGLQRLEPREL